MNDDKLMINLFKGLRDALTEKDGFKVSFISTQLHNMDIPIELFYYDEDTGDFIIGDAEDTSDRTFTWSESTTYYNCDDNTTYCCCVDQDGGEEVVWCEDGLVY